MTQIPEGIPQDVLALAEEAYQHAIYMTTKDEPRNMVRMVAKAILAERERCAQYHDAEMDRIRSLMGGAKGGMGDLFMLLGAHGTSAYAIRHPDYSAPSNSNFKSVPVLGDVS